MDQSPCLAWVGLGSNQGNSLKILHQAQQAMSQLAVKPLQISPIYKTDPWGYTQQDQFFNQVIGLYTRYSAHQLLCSLLDIESHFQRQRSIRWGPRTLDLDLLDYQNVVYQQADLILPHPRLHLRRFVLQPWCDIAPHYYLNPYQATIKELLQCCPDTSFIQKVSVFYSDL